MTRANARALLLLFILLAPPLRSQQSSGEAQPPLIRRVLILNEQNPSYPAISLIDGAFRDSLEKSKYRIEIYREYLDANLFPNEADQKQFRDFYIRKYQNRRPDVIVTIGSTALRLARDLHKTAFAGIPVVFCLPGVEDTADDPDFTGVTMGIDAAGTVSAALRLLPKTKRVFVVGGVAPFDQQQLLDVKEQLLPYRDKVQISYVTDLPMPELQQKLSALSDGDIVLLLSLSLDSAGTKFSSREAAPLITSASSVPVFSLFDVYIGHGEVGGDFSMIRAQGTAAGSAVLKILDGVKPSHIPVANAPNSYMFDWRALKRWGLSESDLPPGSTVLNRRVTAWEQYRRYYIVGISLIFLEAFLISALLRQRIRRRRTETALAMSNERLRLAVEVSKSVGWDWNNITGQNRWFGDLPTIFGINSETHETTVGDFMNYVHRDDRQLVGSAVACAREEHKPYMAEFRIVRTDGAVRWVNARGRFEYSSKGVPERMIGMAMDITERKAAEHKLEESEQRFRLLANAATIMIWTSGRDSQCDYCNETRLKFTGRSMEQEVGEGWSESIHPDDRDGSLRSYKTAFDRRESFEMEYRLRRYDGEYRWVFDCGVPRRSPDGSFLGYIGSCIDITERKLAEDANAALSGRLIAAQEEERRRIAREIHDDYQQQLALVANDLDVLREQIPDPEIRDHVRQLWNQVSELAGDLHSLSHRLHSSTLETLGLVVGVRAYCSEFQQQQGLQISFTSNDVPRNLPPESALCIFRVAQEALRNVTRHSGSDRAEVHLEWTGTAVHLSVTDHGKGFDSRTPSAQGGIGIRSMEERLRLVGGTLELQSQPSHGTRVEAWVPLRVAVRSA